MADNKVRFETKANVNSVVVAIQTRDRLLRIGEKGYETDDPFEIAALEAAEGVKRVATKNARDAEPRQADGDKSDPPAPEAEVR